MVPRSSDGNVREGEEYRWMGYYTYGTGGQAGEKHWMNLVLVMDDGRIRGDGSDVEVGPFELHGAYQSGANEVEFIKRYTSRPDIRYTGFYEEGYGIWGTWRWVRSGSLFRVRSRGEFHIWPRGTGNDHASDRQDGRSARG